MKIHFCDLCNESVPQAALDSGSARRIKGRVICAICDAAMSHGGEHLREPGSNAQPFARAATPPIEPVHPDSADPARDAALRAEREREAVLRAERDAHAREAHVRAEHDPHLRGDRDASVRAAGFEEPRGAVPAYVAHAPVAVAPVAVAPAPARSNAGLAWIAGLAIAFTALSIFVTDDRLARMGRLQSALQDEMAKKDDALHGLATEFAKIHPALAGVETRLTQQMEGDRARTAASAEALAGLRQDLARYDARVEALAGELEKLRARVEKPGIDPELEKRFDELSGRIAKAEDDRRALSEQVAAASSAPLQPAAGPAAAPANVPAAPPAWSRNVEDLASTDEGVRWDAVTTLGATNDPAVIPHLLPMLDDPTWLVRMAAARVLGEMRARDAVPQLIAMLEDVDSAARETAWIALRVITGKDLKFDSFAPEAERAKRAKAWSDWWKKEGAGEAPKPPAGS